MGRHYLLSMGFYFFPCFALVGIADSSLAAEGEVWQCQSVEKMDSVQKKHGLFSDKVVTNASSECSIDLLLKFDENFNLLIPDLVNRPAAFLPTRDASPKLVYDVGGYKLS